MVSTVRETAYLDPFGLAEEVVVEVGFVVEELSVRLVVLVLALVVLLSLDVPLVAGPSGDVAVVVESAADESVLDVASSVVVVVESALDTGTSLSVGADGVGVSRGAEQLHRMIKQSKRHRIVLCFFMEISFSDSHGWLGKIVQKYRCQMTLTRPCASDCRLSSMPRIEDGTEIDTGGT